jgi:uncharacterized protein YdiU (UPF0061 family)
MWNLYQLGAALTVAFPNLPVEELLENFSDAFTVKIHERLLKRLNLRNPLESASAQAELNISLVSQLFQFMSVTKVLFEQTLFDLHSGVNETRLQNSPQSAHYQSEHFKALKETLDCFEVADDEIQRHDYFTHLRPCSLLIDELEAIWAPIAAADDWSLFDNKLQQIRSIRGLY